jgi:putative ABC transport system permease protein
MFDRRWRKMLRDAWLHKPRTLLAILAMAIGLTAAGALLDTWGLVQQVTATTYLASNPASATLRLDRVDAQLLGQVRALPDIASARARRTAFASTLTGATAKRAELFALDDFSHADIGRLSPEAGSWPPRAGEIVIERSALEFSGATLGESIRVSVGDAPAQTLRVSGIVRDVSLAPGWMENTVYGFVAAETLAQLGAPAGFDELQFRVRDAGADRAAVRRIADRVKGISEELGRRVINIDVPVPGRHIHAAQMDSLMLTQAAFGLLALIVCALLVVNLVAAMLAGQVREIGIMKSLGAGSAQIAGMYLGFALALGVVATALSTPLALLIGREYATMKADMLNFPIGANQVPLWTIALQVAIGCLLPVAAAAFPVARGCRLPVASALRAIGIAVPKAGRNRRMIAIEGIGRPLLLSIGNAFRRRGRLVLTLLALSAGGAVYLSAANLRAGVIASVDRLFVDQHFDFSLRLTGTATTDAVEKLALAVDGIAAAEAWNSLRAAHAFSDGTRGQAFAIVGLPPDSTLLTPTFARGRAPTAQDRNAMVVGTGLLRDEPDLDVGATIKLLIDEQPAEWTVVGVVESGPVPAAYTSRATVAAARGTDRASMLVVRTAARNAALQLDVIQRLRNALDAAGEPVGGSMRVDENRRVVEDHLLMVVQFLGAMSWVMILVGGMGLASTMSLAVLERTREIGVLRAIGARHRDILLLVVVEGVVIAVLAWLIALPLSVPMSVALGDAFGHIMFPVPRTYVPVAIGVATWFGLMTVVALVASLWPALRAARVPTAAALAYE